MGFFSKIKDGISLLPAIDKYVLGGDAKDAAKSAAKAQGKAVDKSIAFQTETRDLAREDLAPFVQFGADQMNPLMQMLTSQGQADYVQNNPLFTAALDSVNRATMNNAAARGKLGSGGTLSALQNNYLATALPFIQDQRNALFNAVNMGQSSAAGQANTALSTGNSIADLYTQKGNAIAAGKVGAANARQQGVNNILDLGSRLFGASMGGA